MPKAAYHHRHRVTYSECTLGNHVYYARYLDLLEEARGEFMRSRGLTFLELQAREFAFPVVACHLHYRAAARYDDVLDIEVSVGRVERVRLEFIYHIADQEGRLILEATTRHVCTNLEEKPRRLPEDLIRLLSGETGPGNAPADQAGSSPV